MNYLYKLNLCILFIITSIVCMDRTLIKEKEKKAIQTCIAMKDITRKYPNDIHDLVEDVARNLQNKQYPIEEKNKEILKKYKMLNGDNTIDTTTSIAICMYYNNQNINNR